MSIKIKKGIRVVFGIMIIGLIGITALLFSILSDSANRQSLADQGQQRIEQRNKK